MAKGSFKQIDLLRKRRMADSVEPYFLDTKKYIKKGIFSGLTLIALSLILGIPFIFRVRFLECDKVKIKNDNTITKKLAATAPIIKIFLRN